uniref:Transposase (putative) gypsy type domain-containing protein n=1 Tax=Oryza sativa subsp. japonica TaxID=39947 RepID=Q60EH0_ORYSJ|nr:hypothetical protein [Oryza sativa Japonica Group]
MVSSNADLYSSTLSFKPLQNWARIILSGHMNHAITVLLIEGVEKTFKRHLTFGGPVHVGEEEEVLFTTNPCVATCKSCSSLMPLQCNRKGKRKRKKEQREARTKLGGYSNVAARRDGNRRRELDCATAEGEAIAAAGGGRRPTLRQGKAVRSIPLKLLGNGVERTIVEEPASLISLALTGEDENLFGNHLHDHRQACTQSDYTALPRVTLGRDGSYPPPLCRGDVRTWLPYPSDVTVPGRSQTGHIRWIESHVAGRKVIPLYFTYPRDHISDSSPRCYIRFFHEVLDFYEIHALHLAPNAVMTLAIFAHLYEMFIGVRPTMRLFQAFFIPQLLQGAVVGGCYFQPRPGTAGQYIESHLRKKWEDWKKDWFYTALLDHPRLRVPAGPPERSAAWLATSELGEEYDAVWDRLRGLRSLGLTGAMVFGDYFRRRIAPLQE